MLTKPPIADLNFAHPLARGLVVCCPFDEGIGDYFRNLVHPFNRGRLHPSASTPEWVDNISGSAFRVAAGPTGNVDNYGLVFGGESNSTGLNIITGAQPRTVFLITRRREAQTANGILTLGNEVTGERWTFRYTTSGSLRIEVQGAGFDFSLVPVLGVPGIIALVYEGGTLASHTLYVNKTSQVATGTATVNTGTLHHQLLADVTNAFTLSSTDEVLLYLLYDRALTQDEIFSLVDNPWQIFTQKRINPGWLFAVTGGQLYEVTVTDGIVFNDLSTKDTASNKVDALLLGDAKSSLLERILSDGIMLQDTTLNQKLTQLLTTDTLALSDTAFIQKLSQLLVTDSILITDSRVTAIDKTLLDTLMVYDAMAKVVERVRQDTLLLGDSAAFLTGITGQIYTVLVTDGLMLLDSIFKAQAVTKNDQVQITDASARGTDRYGLDRLLVRDSMIKDRSSVIRDSLLLGDSRFTDTARILIDRILVSDQFTRLTDLTVMDRVLLGELVTIAREIVMREGLYLYDAATTSVTESIVAALVYARLTMTDLLSISAQTIDPLGLVLDDNIDMLGIDIGFQRPDRLQ